MRTRFLIFVAIISSLALLACSGGGGDSESEGSDEPVEQASPTPTPVDANAGERVWTVAEILAEPKTGGSGGEPLCGGEFGFKRCLCAPDVPFYVRYRPAVAECNGFAAAILSGPLLDAFSVVVRDTQNRDRWPEAGSGFGGCSFEEANSESPPARCSAFKVQSSFIIGQGAAKVNCFGASGYDPIFADAVRLTVKLSDDPFSNDDDIERYCLNGPTNPLN